MSIDRKYSVVAVILLSIIAYVLLGYFIPRTAFITTLIVYTILFALYFFILNKPLNLKLFKYLFFGALLFRIILVFSTPALSDDFYRFLWDGQLIQHGINPYTFLPNELIGQFSESKNMQVLFDGMNSQNYFSVYPPLAQFSYYIATFFTENIYGAIVVYKLLILLAEIALFQLLIRFLIKLNKAKELAFVYFLNPLIILEFSGNMHGEVFVILGLFVSAWLLLKKRYTVAAIAFGLAVSFKLLPLIFLPLIIRFTGIKKGVQFSFVVLFVVALTFVPFIDSRLISHMGESVGLYFNSFEFNSSISNLVRFLSRWFTGSSNILIVGKVMGVCALLLIVVFSLKPIKHNAESLFQRMSLLLLVYLLFAMSIHPWYITPLIAFAVLIPLRYGVVWSYLIFLTYITYTVVPYQQNIYLISFEYLVLLILFLSYKKRRISVS